MLKKKLNPVIVGIKDIDKKGLKKYSEKKIVSFAKLL